MKYANYLSTKNNDGQNGQNPLSLMGLGVLLAMLATGAWVVLL